MKKILISLSILMVLAPMVVYGASVKKVMNYEAEIIKLQLRVTQLENDLKNNRIIEDFRYEYDKNDEIHMRGVLEFSQSPKDFCSDWDYDFAKASGQGLGLEFKKYRSLKIGQTSIGAMIDSQNKSIDNLKNMCAKIGY